MSLSMLLYQPLVPKEYLPVVSLIMLILLLGIPTWHFGKAWWEWRKEEKEKFKRGYSLIKYYGEKKD